MFACSAHDFYDPSMGRSLSEMILRGLVHLADTPSLAEIEARLASLPPVEVPGGAAEVIKQERVTR